MALYPQNDALLAFLRANGYLNDYNDGFHQYLVDYTGKHRSTAMPDLFNAWDGNLTVSTPAFSQDFSTETLESEWTFTRSTIGTRYNSSGVLVTAAIDAERYDYDPVTNEFAGLLIEKASTNKTVNSEALSGTGWSSSRVVITTNTQAAPDGNTTADTITEDTASGTHQIFYIDATLSPGIGNQLTNSIYVKKGTGTRYLQVLLAGGAFGGGTAPTGVFNLDTGATNATGSPDDITMQDVGNGWWRCSITATTTDASTSVTVLYRLKDTFSAALASYTGDGTSSLHMWGSQVEVSSEASSYIPTAGTAVTRAADLLAISGADFTGMYNATTGGVVADCNFNSDRDVTLVTIDDGTTSNYMGVKRNGAETTVLAHVVDGGVEQVNETLTSGGDNSMNKIAFTYAANDFRAAINGSQVVSDTSLTLPTVDRIQIGNLVPGNFRIVSFDYYDESLSNTFLTFNTI